ncbi:MAG: molybdate ABC transporter substrate-binding protein [Rhodospirillaceae bacterium]
MNRRPPLGLILLFCFTLLCPVQDAQSTETKRIIVLAAASTTTALNDIAEQYQSETGISVRVSISSSGTLARQIMQGAPADIYIAAAQDWIRTLTAAGYIEPDYTRILARNRLVIVSPKTENATRLLNTSKPVEVLRRLDGGRLAIGDPAHVPAGRYAQQALENLGLWAAVRDRLARQVNVRAVLAMVERGETPLGIVYATDAALSQKVRLAAIIPPESHTPIIYTAAVISGRALPPVLDFYNYLSTAAAQSILESHGFAVMRDVAADPGSADQPLRHQMPTNQTATTGPERP